MIDGSDLLAAMLSLHEATEQSLKRLEAKMDAGFRDVGARLYALEMRMEALERRVETVESRLTSVENRLGGLEDGYVALGAEFVDSETRFVLFEAKVFERFDGLDVRLMAVERT